MTLATYVFEVDWDNDDTYGHAQSDITGDFILIQTRTGRDFASQLTGRAPPGVLTAILDNRDGKYSPFNTSSPITGLVVPGRKVRLRTTAPSAVTLWTGFLDTIEPTPDMEGGHTATLRARGPLSKLEEPRVNIEPQTNILTGDAMDDVLDAAGWPVGDRDIDAGNTTMSRWVVEAGEEGEEALVAAHDVAEAEGRGFLRETRDGNIKFEDRQHRLKTDHLTTQATFSDIPSDPDGDASYSAIFPENAWAEVYNEAVAKTQRQTVGSVVALWTLAQSGADSPQLEIGDSITFEAFYPSPDDPVEDQGVDAWITPSVGTDITANSAADGTGDNLNADIAVSDVEKGLTTMRFTVTNNSGRVAFLTLVQARGAALTREKPANVVAINQASIDKYGRRTYPVPSKFISEVEDAKDYTSWIVNMFSEPIPVVAIEFPATKDSNHMSQALARDVSDRIRIKSDERTGLGIDHFYFIEAMTHHIRDAGTVHIVGIEASPIEGFGRGWILDTSAFDTETVLAY